MKDIHYPYVDGKYACGEQPSFRQLSSANLCYVTCAKCRQRIALDLTSAIITSKPVRMFVHTTGFGDSAAVVKFVNGVCTIIKKDGTESPYSHTLDFALEAAREGIWREIT